MLFRFDETGSTNEVARALADDGAARHGAVILASYQQTGRGQEQTEWESEKGKNILCSILLEPHFLTPERQIYLNLALSLAVCDGVRKHTGKRVSIKWPNDIYIEKKKVAGILIENSWQNNALRLCIAGIGFNVNQDEFIYPQATSLKLQEHKENDLMEVFNELMGCVNEYYNWLKEGKDEMLFNAYISNMFGLNQLIHFVSNGNPFTASVRGIDASGRLMLEADGAMHFFNNKEVEWKI